MTDIHLVLVSCPQDFAPVLAEKLVDERLAACVNIVPAIASVYRWQETIETEPEALLLIKAPVKGFDALRERVTELHPYELPEVIAVCVDDASKAYLDWVHDNTAQA